jgi:hypothetical protein
VWAQEDETMAYEQKVKKAFPIGVRVALINREFPKEWGPVTRFRGWKVEGYSYDSTGALRVEVDGDARYLPEDLAIVPNLD